MTDDLRPSEVAARLGTSTRTVQRWIASGRLPARRVGARWRVASDAFDAFEPPVTTESPRAGPISALFVANRGEIAARIARTCARLDIRVIIPTTTGPGALDLLDSAAVVAAASAHGADAVHPGFGFLAENADFAEAVLAAGLVWVGPPPAAIRAMGDKAAARRLAASLDVPVPAGYDGDDQSVAALTAAATTIGTPLLVKPAAGGGGKGMRTVRDPARLPVELAAAQREAMAAFGDDRLVLERLVERARHVEIQVLFDGAGGAVHLGERDCSVQRRHQKVLEESPSPAVDETLRARMGDAALRLGAAVGYVGAGTCEFLLDESGAFTFLEMNTRLQVEHPVTELVTGRDLVADQLRIAAGESLGFDQAGVERTGHAIEVRLYAEDADAGFLPATGTIVRLVWPTGPGIRVDAGIDVGDEVSDRFDPMLAKIIAWGPDRPSALDRLAQALDETVVLGVTTNLRFLRWLVRRPVVIDGDVRIDTLERIWPPDDGTAARRIPDAAWATAAALLTDTTAGAAASRSATMRGATARSGVTSDAWTGGWRLNAPPLLRLTAGEETVATTPGHDPAVLAVQVGDVVHVDVDGRSVAIRLADPPDVDRAARAAAGHHGGAVELVAPMPGRVRSIQGSVGGPVAAGDPVVVLEAMKMEHAVSPTIDGRLIEIRVVAGDQVTRGQILAVVEP